MSILPDTLEEALTPEWLSNWLAPGHTRPHITCVDNVTHVQDVSFKPRIVRFSVHFEDGSSAPYCLKAVLRPSAGKLSNSTSLREAKFFNEIAPHLSIRLPPVIAAPFDEAQGTGFLLMRDMVAEGARFMSVLDPWRVEWIFAILDQMAQLHALHHILGPIERIGWASSNVEWLPDAAGAEWMQPLLDGPRSPGLPGRTRDAQLVIDGLRAFAKIDSGRTPFLVHGDSNASNIFLSADGPGLTDWQLIQRGHWALDVAYHITSTLPVEAAEREERMLFEYYFDRAHAHGAPVGDSKTAWLEYRQSLIYGHFLASITRSFEAPIINETSKRMAHAVYRHDTFRLLGL